MFSKNRCDVLQPNHVISVLIRSNTCKPSFSLNTTTLCHANCQLNKNSPRNTNMIRIIELMSFLSLQIVESVQLASNEGISSNLVPNAIHQTNWPSSVNRQPESGQRPASKLSSCRHSIVFIINISNKPGSRLM